MQVIISFWNEDKSATKIKNKRTKQEITTKLEKEKPRKLKIVEEIKDVEKKLIKVSPLCHKYALNTLNSLILALTKKTLKDVMT